MKSVLTSVLVVSSVVGLCVPAHALPARERTQKKNRDKIVEQYATLVSQLTQHRKLAEYARRNILELTDLTAGEIWRPFSRTAKELSKVIEGGQAISYTLANLDSIYSRRFEGYRHYQQGRLLGRRLQDLYKKWFITNRDTVLSTLRGLGLDAEDLRTEDALMERLQQMSRRPDGHLQALMAGNMLSTFQVRHLGRLRQLASLSLQLQASYFGTESDREAAWQAAWEEILEQEETTVGNEEEGLW